jgi:hypothetical protein
MAKKMTRDEFVRLFDERLDLCVSSELAANLAETAGVEWLPEQIEPKVSDTLTEATRLVQDLAAVTLANTVWQCDDPNGLGVWVAGGVGWSITTADVIQHGGRIVFVPGEPVTEQKHGTRVIRDGLLRGTFRWDCACGAYDHDYIAEATAQRDAAKHEAQS